MINLAIGDLIIYKHKLDANVTLGYIIKESDTCYVIDIMKLTDKKIYIQWRDSDPRLNDIILYPESYVIDKINNSIWIYQPVKKSSK